MLKLFKEYSKIKNLSGIYKIITLHNNEFYIGSALSLSKRMKDHRNLLKANKHFNTRLQNVYNKYGENNFSIEIIKMHNCIFKFNSENYKLLIKDEEYYINNLNSEYNFIKTPTSQKNNPTTSKKIHQYDFDGKYIRSWNSIREVDRMINIQVKIGVNRSAGGYQWSYTKEESLSKYSPLQGLRNPISTYSIEGVKIKTYPSISSCAKELFPNISFNKSFQSINHASKTGKVFNDFRFKIGNDNILDNSKNKMHKKGYIISQYDLKMNLIKHWATTGEAEKKLKLKSIYDNIIGKTKTCGGYIFKKL